MHLTFGRYKGRSIQEVIETDIEYVQWLVSNYSSMPIGIKHQVEKLKQLAAPSLNCLMEQEQQMKAARRPLLEPVMQAMKACIIVNKLKHSKSPTPWFMSVMSSIDKGDKISVNAQELVAHVCSKTRGRRNSKKYVSMKETIEQAFAAAYNDNNLCTQ